MEVTQAEVARSQRAAALGAADLSRSTRAVGARSQLAATLGATGQAGVVSKPARESGKKGFGFLTNQSTDCSGGANCIQTRAQRESQIGRASCRERVEMSVGGG